MWGQQKFILAYSCKQTNEQSELHNLIGRGKGPIAYDDRLYKHKQRLSNSILDK